METLEYLHGSLIDLVEDKAKDYANNIAYEFMGKKVTYSQFIKDINHCAKALLTLGIKEGDIVCISMPNTPQAITFFYAVNKIGAVANMIHPLSSEKEMFYLLTKVKAKTLLLMNQFFNSIENIIDQTSLENIIIADIKDALPWIKKLPYQLTIGRKIKPVTRVDKVIKWNDFLAKANNNLTLTHIDDADDKLAVILQSGGTTGKMKGVCLSNMNINACAIQMKAANPMINDQDKMLSVMPIFHGNGLVIGVHTMLITGARCILIPRFSPESYAQELLNHKCNYMSGVPTLFEKLMETKCMKNADLSFLKGVFSGADYLSVELERRIDEFLKNHNAKVLVRQGYGMTEGVVASSLNPVEGFKEGSIGLPLPDTIMKIVDPETSKEVPIGEVGEIVFSSRTNMLGYYNDVEETNNTLRLHEDGNYYIHSGDLGYQDSDNFFYFKGRIKRMIVTNGYNVFPMELENIIESHELVDRCCVLGIPDKDRGEKVKAYIVLKNKENKTVEVKNTLMSFFKETIARYAYPREIEFVDELPKTKVGKVDYNKLREKDLTK